MDAVETIAHGHLKMPTRDKAGEGRTATSLAMQNIQEAISQWRTAPDTEKSARAFSVLSHIGSLPGMKLADFVDEETAKQIRADFESSN